MRRSLSIAAVMAVSVLALAACSKHDAAVDAATEEHPTAQLEPMTAEEQNRQAALEAAAAANAPSSSANAPAAANGAPPDLDPHAPAPAAEAAHAPEAAHPPAAARAPSGHR